MKKYKIAFQMTQSMFCSLPFPSKEWDETCRPYMLIFLPMIGLEIGCLWVLIDWLTQYFAIPALIRGLVLCGWPYAVTGFLHLDGFMDVIDAVCSWRPLERRREILKDSHVGSFAVVWCAFLLLAGFSAFSSMPGHAEMGVLLFIPVVSRCCSALAVMKLKTMNTSQYANTTNYPKWHAWALDLILIVSITICGILWGKVFLALLGGLAGYAIALRKSYRSLDGMNGDISGFCICISELCAVLLMVFL